MVTNDEIAKVVNGVASQYAKDIVKGTGWRYDVFEEYRQELFVKAYEILSEDPNVSIQVIAKSLWNRATDVFRAEMRRTTNEQSTDAMSGSELDDEEFIDYSINDAIIRKSESEYESVIDTQHSPDLVERVLDMISDRDESIRKYVIAKLKLNGYLSKDSYPDIKVSLEEFDASTDTENCKIIKDVLSMGQAVTGGTVKFKQDKRSLLLDLISEFDVEDCYRKWYVARYKDNMNEYKVIKIKKYSEADVVAYLRSLEDFKSIDYINLAE